MRFQIVNADITSLTVDAIVNPTDAHFSGSGNTDLAIHQAAGVGLRAECSHLPELQTGAIAVTGGYELPCRYVFHTVGPVWQGGGHNEAILLRSCYVNALLQAKKLGAASIAFPLISSGSFGFPKDQVMELAIGAIRDFQETLDGELDVTLCVFHRTAFELHRKDELEAFLARKAQPLPMMDFCAAESMPASPRPKASIKGSLEQWLQKRDDTFAVTLLKLIDQKGMTEVECYKKAQVTKKTFWKINNTPNYHPSKQTALAFAIALELSLEETEQFLKTVGYSLSHSNTFDLIIEYYITSGIYDLYEINAALYRYDQVCLGC